MSRPETTLPAQLVNNYFINKFNLKYNNLIV